MNDFRLRAGRGLRLPRARSPSLGNATLRLDPTIEQEIRRLRQFPPSPRLRRAFLHPSWERMREEELQRLLRQPPPPGTAPLVPAGAGPDEIRVADVSDIFDAFMAVPSVRNLRTRALDEVSGRLQRDFNRLNTGQMVLVISHSALIAGAAVTVANLDDDPPEFPLGLLLNREFPIPPVDGLSFRLRHRGGRVSWENIGSSGVSAQAGARAAQGDLRIDVSVTLDVARWLPVFR